MAPSGSSRTLRLTSSPDIVLPNSAERRNVEDGIKRVVRFQKGGAIRTDTRSPARFQLKCHSSGSLRFVSVKNNLLKLTFRNSIAFVLVNGFSCVSVTTFSKTFQFPLDLFHPHNSSCTTKLACDV